MFQNMDKLTKGMLVLHRKYSTLCILNLFKSKIWLVGCQYGIEEGAGCLLERKGKYIQSLKTGIPVSRFKRFVP